MRYGFITCVELGRACIEEILTIGGHLELLGTLHDDLARQKSGRTYVDDLARKAEAPLVKFRNVNDADALEAIRDADLDWLFIVGWSQIARRDVLDSTRRGVIGMHPTLLPEGRGRAAVPWAILKGLERTGVTMFKLAEGVDTGDILAQQEIPIAERETATTLYAKVALAHRHLIRDSWHRLDRGLLEPQAQDEQAASVWPGRRPEDGLLVPQSMTVQEVDRHVRALTHPYPGASVRRESEILKIWEGHPADHCQHASLPKLDCRDGQFCVTDFTVDYPDER